MSNLLQSACFRSTPASPEHAHRPPCCSQAWVWRLAHAELVHDGVTTHGLLLPAQVVDVSTSKTGKHGHAKCHFVALDIFTGKKLEDLQPSSHNSDVSH